MPEPTKAIDLTYEERRLLGRAVSLFIDQKGGVSDTPTINTMRRLLGKVDALAAE